MAARLTPDQKVGSSNLSGLTYPGPWRLGRYDGHAMDTWTAHDAWAGMGWLGGMGRRRVGQGGALLCGGSDGQPTKGLWRNGSASDSRSEGWDFESLWPHMPRALAAGAI